MTTLRDGAITDDDKPMPDVFSPDLLLHDVVLRDTECEEGTMNTEFIDFVTNAIGDGWMLDAGESVNPWKRAGRCQYSAACSCKRKVENSVFQSAESQTDRSLAGVGIGGRANGL